MNTNEKALVIAALGYLAVLAGEYAHIQSVSVSLQFVGMGTLLVMGVYVIGAATPHTLISHRE